MIEVVEIGDDNGDGQGDRQDAGDRTQRAHNLPPDSHGPATQLVGAASDQPIPSVPVNGESIANLDSVLGVVFLSCVSLPSVSSVALLMRYWRLL